MDTLIQISIYSVLVLTGLGAVAAMFVFAGHALAEEAVEEEVHDEH